jgi:HEPN domain-containing protein
VQAVTEQVRNNAARRWMRQATSDLRTADLVMSEQDFDPGPVCYHSQQAADKAMKAVFVFLQVQYEMTHNLEVLAAPIPQGWAVKRVRGNLKKLSDWAVKARYPGTWLDPTRRDAQQALRLSRRIYEAVSKDLAKHGLSLE